jgi:hypothetical protein
MTSDSEEEFFFYKMPAHLKRARDSSSPETELQPGPSCSATQDTGDHDTTKSKRWASEPPVSDDTTPSVSHERESAPDKGLADTAVTMHRPFAPGASWACDDKGDPIWASVKPRGQNGGTDTIIIVYAKTVDGNRLFAPLVSAQDDKQSICTNEQERSALIEQLTQTITTLNPSACQDFRSKQLSAGARKKTSG